MSFLNILAYIGITLGAALLLAILNVIFSRKRKRYIVGDEVFSGSEGSYAIAFMIALLEFCGLLSWMMIKLFSMSVVKGIGVAALLTFVAFFVFFILGFFLSRKSKKSDSDEELEDMCFISLLFTCLADGILISVMLAKLGLF